MDTPNLKYTLHQKIEIDLPLSDYGKTTNREEIYYVLPYFAKSVVKQE